MKHKKNLLISVCLMSLLCACLAGVLFSGVKEKEFIMKKCRIIEIGREPSFYSGRVATYYEIKVINSEDNKKDTLFLPFLKSTERVKIDTYYEIHYIIKDISYIANNKSSSKIIKDAKVIVIINKLEE